MKIRRGRRRKAIEPKRITIRLTDKQAEELWRLFMHGLDEEYEDWLSVVKGEMHVKYLKRALNKFQTALWSARKRENDDPDIKKG